MSAFFLDPIEYERFVAYWLARQGFYRIRLTPNTADYGADILCERFGYKYVVQCKLYSKPVGYHAVEEVLGALHYYQCHGAIIVTNSTFTKQAKKGAERTGVLLFEHIYCT